MSVPLRLSHERADELLSCLDDGQPLQPIGEAWTTDDLLAVAGVCLYAVLTTFRGRRDDSGQPEERVESRDGRLFDALTAAATAYAKLCGRAAARTWDRDLEPEVEAAVDVDADGRPTLTPVSGFGEVGDTWS